MHCISVCECVLKKLILIFPVNLCYVEQSYASKFKQIVTGTMFGIFLVNQKAKREKIFLYGKNQHKNVQKIFHHQFDRHMKGMS